MSRVGPELVQQAVVIVVAGGGEVLQRQIEPGALFHVEFGQVAGRLDAAVEHERPDVVRNSWRTSHRGRAAVREADEASSWSSPRASRIRSSRRGVVGSDVGRRAPTSSSEQVSALAVASASKSFQPSSSPASSRDDVVVDHDLALDRGAGAHPTRVEADEVESLGDLGRYGDGGPTTGTRSPEPPGPPGLNTSEPMRSSGSVAGDPVPGGRSIVSPSGSSWSSGTGQGRALELDATGRELLARPPVERADFGRTARVAGDGRVRRVRLDRRNVRG